MISPPGLFHPLNRLTSILLLLWLLLSKSTTTPEHTASLRLLWLLLLLIILSPSRITAKHVVDAAWVLLYATFA